MEFWENLVFFLCFFLLFWMEWEVGMIEVWKDKMEWWNWAKAQPTDPPTLTVPSSLLSHLHSSPLPNLTIVCAGCVCIDWMDRWIAMWFGWRCIGWFGFYFCVFFCFVWLEWEERWSDEWKGKWRWWPSSSVSGFAPAHCSEHLSSPLLCLVLLSSPFPLLSTSLSSLLCCCVTVLQVCWWRWWWWWPAVM